MIVFSVIFGRFAGLPSDGIPYPVFTFCALLPWIYFARSLVGASDSLVQPDGTPEQDGSGEVQRVQTIPLGFVFRI